MAAALWVIEGEGGSDSDSRGYEPNTSRVGTSPSGPIVSLTALTESYKKIALPTLMPANSSDITSYARRKGA